ncbi:hypothetical protein DVK05_06225 [Halorubrum sp. Atlit-8R]|uniref:hypothetical protein n=1 Tax=unclassified Halorubrum TaxID=2642239 RepID=UPI000EF26429|nr:MULTISPECIES: hypothetical protein [unclassified Halorubrum]RLM66826.1 hypothetical protein DVK08_13245 [Halorubrum sp. Atlit-9R]RLM81649.1 hypothetical protein DVK05_06225 [Halorubrum sp. Atlit-8R]
MPSTTRRAFAAGLSTAVAAVAGCGSSGSAPVSAHWVSVYLGEREETHDVTVAVLDGSGATLFEETYRISDGNEADEDATFSGSSAPETVVVTIDGTRFERDWPGFERAELPCEEPNRSGVELWVENDRDGDPTVRMEAGCQHVASG